MNDKQAALEVFKYTGGRQSGGDWPADYWFAKLAINVPSKSLSAIEELQGNFGVAPLAMGYHRVHCYKQITQRRQRALRYWVKRGVVRAFWTGTGPGGMADFGINKNRNYVFDGPAYARWLNK